MTRALLLLALLLCAGPAQAALPGWCSNGDCPPLRFTFTAPGDVHAEISTWPAGVALPITRCANYRFVVKDQNGLRFPMGAYADTLFTIKHPGPYGFPDTVYAVAPQPFDTWSYRLASQDSAGNWNEHGNAVVVAQTGPVTPDSCCTLQLSFSPSRAPGPLVFKPDWRASYASFVLGVPDSGAALIETSGQAQRHYRDTVCSWPWQRAKGWPLGGKWEPCP